MKLKDHFALKNFLSTKIGNKTHYHYEHPENDFKWEGTAWDKKEARSKAQDAYEKHIKKLKEDAPTNNAGDGSAVQTNVQTKPERPPARRGKMFGRETFIVSSSTFNSIKHQKKKGMHWKRYLEEDDAYYDLREYARKERSNNCRGRKNGRLYVCALWRYMK
jgi:hypothetical protein